MGPRKRNRVTAAQAADDSVCWSWAGARMAIGRTGQGSGPTLLLLPALSSISTRREMAPLQRLLSKQFHTVSIDWPGFGDRPRPRVDWTPAALAAFLSFVLTELHPNPDVIVAAGHAGGYLLRHASRERNLRARLVLIAPTWRGPLPTMLGDASRRVVSLRRLVDLPVMGPALYKLNVNQFVIRHMAAGHVYADKDWLSRQRVADKLAVIRAAGARHASARFVLGCLDPFHSRQAYLDAARATAASMLVIYGADTPSRSLAEIEALADVGTVRMRRLPRGKLSVHEEFPAQAAAAIADFLRRTG
jgi:pimeloyl-ACP methyl ester carboxylesterase